MRAGTAGPGERVAAGPRPARQTVGPKSTSRPRLATTIFTAMSNPEAGLSNPGDALARATLAKVTRRLLPFLFLLYIVCFLDRVNIGFAALQMNRELGFSPTMYGLGAGIFFLGYVLCEIPSNLILA